MSGERGTHGAPKTGIYLDAALSAVGERIEERIDRLQGRRRTRTRALVATLSAATLLGGAATAAALTFAAPPDAIGTARVTLEVSCVAATDPTTEAYFAARFRIPESDADGVAPEALCAAAWNAAQASPELADTTPDRLLATTAELVRRSWEPREVDGEPAPAPEVQTLSATFVTPRSDAATPRPFAVCGTASAPTVLLAAGSSPSVPGGCVATREPR